MRTLVLILKSEHRLEFQVTEQAVEPTLRNLAGGLGSFSWRYLFREQALHIHVREPLASIVVRPSEVRVAYLKPE